MPNKINQSQIKATAPQVVVTNLSSADILALNGTPIEVAPAPGAGKKILPYLIVFSYGGQGKTAYDVSGGGNMEIHWGTNNPFSCAIDNGVLNGTVNQSYDLDSGGHVETIYSDSDVENQPLMLKNGGGGEYTTGTGTAKITVYYNIVSVG